jgi:hypothetical protein
MRAFCASNGGKSEYQVAHSSLETHLEGNFDKKKRFEEYLQNFNTPIPHNYTCKSKVTSTGKRAADSRSGDNMAKPNRDVLGADPSRAYNISRRDTSSIDLHGGKMFKTWDQRVLLRLLYPAQQEKPMEGMFLTLVD